MYPIIDIHCHIYPDKIAEKVTSGLAGFYDIEVKYDGRLETLKRVSAAAGISHCVIFSAATKPNQVTSINKFICDNVNRSHGRMTGLGTLHPDSLNIEADIDDLLSLGLKGVKLHPDAQGFKADDEKCFRIYELCEKRKIPILFHCGDSRYDFSNPDRIKNVLKAFPDLQAIGAHFGGWSLWEQAANELHGFENFMVDSSSAYKWLDRETVRRIISLYGADRVMFATDYPMWEPKDDIEYLLSLGLPKKDYEKIFYLNASKVFKICL